MGVFYIFKFVQMVPNHVKRLIYYTHNQRTNLPISEGILPISEGISSYKNQNKFNF